MSAQQTQDFTASTPGLSVAKPHLIATLAAELPTLFKQDLTYDIYTPDIRFRDPVSAFNGKLNYRIIFWTLRFHGRLFFTDLHFDVHQINSPAEQIITVDWTVRGTLRLPWQPNLEFDGQSTYTIAPDGRIAEHVDTWDRPPRDILKQFLPQS